MCFAAQCFCGMAHSSASKKSNKDDSGSDPEEEVRTMCGSRTGGWSLPCVMSD
jgi:hypothetical protein